MVRSRKTWAELGLVLVLVVILFTLPGCEGHDGKNDFLTWLAGLWSSWYDVAVRTGMGPVLHLLGRANLEIAGSAALTDVGTAAAPIPTVFSCNVDLGGAGGYDYAIVLRGTTTAGPGDGSFHIVCDTPEGTPTTDTVTLDLTPNEDHTQLSGTLTFNHDGEDFTGDATFNKEETP